MLAANNYRTVLKDASNWIFENRQWVFSGVGVAILALIFGAMRFRKTKSEVLASVELQDLNRPRFRWTHSSTDNISLTCQFQNVGGAVSRLVVQSRDGVTCTIAPQYELPSQQNGFVRFQSERGRLAPPIRFEIRYITRSNVEETRIFLLQAVGRNPVEEEG